jgi:hypothetical protein
LPSPSSVSISAASNTATCALSTYLQPSSKISNKMKAIGFGKLKPSQTKVGKTLGF